MFNEQPAPIAEPVKARLDVTSGIAADESQGMSFVRADACCIEGIDGSLQIQNGFGCRIVLLGNVEVINAGERVHLFRAGLTRQL